MLKIEDSIAYVRENGKTLYVAPERKTIGNTPVELHAELQEYAETKGLKMFQLVGALWDFFREYEGENAKELAADRAKRRR